MLIILKVTVNNLLFENVAISLSQKVKLTMNVILKTRNLNINCFIVFNHKKLLMTLKLHNLF